MAKHVARTCAPPTVPILRTRKMGLSPSRNPRRAVSRSSPPTNMASTKTYPPAKPGAGCRRTRNRAKPPALPGDQCVLVPNALVRPGDADDSPAQRPARGITIESTNQHGANENISPGKAGGWVLCRPTRNRAKPPALQDSYAEPAPLPRGRLAGNIWVSRPGGRRRLGVLPIATLTLSLARSSRHG